MTPLLPKKTATGPAWVGPRVRKEGALFEILEVIPGSPAARAGLTKDMRVFSVQGKFPADVAAIREIVNKIGPRGRLRLSLIRNGKESPVVVRTSAPKGSSLGEDGFDEL